MKHQHAARLKLAPFALFALPAALTATLLTGCLGGDGDGASRRETVDVVDIDPVAQTITTREVYHYCQGTEAVSDTVLEDERYHIADGTLYHWEPGYSCAADITTGKSTSIVGTWTGNPPRMHDAPVSDSAFCDEEAYSDRAVLTEVVRNAKVVDVITASKITTSVTGRICFGEVYGWLLTTNAGMDEVIERSGKQCGAVTLTRLDSAFIDFDEEVFGPTAKVTATETATGVKVVFTTGEVRCEETVADEETAESCADGGGGQARLEACAYASGFFGNDIFFKKGGSSENRKTLRSLLRGL